MPDKPPSVSAMRAKGKMHRSIKVLTVFLDMHRHAYEDYIRLHRLLYDVNPDPDDVADAWDVEE